MAETYYDPETHKLVVGEAALAAENAYHEMGDYDFDQPVTDDEHGNLYSLPDLLTRTTLPENVTRSRSEYQRSWDRESIIQLGHWALKLIRSTGSRGLREEHFDRLNKLGISPDSSTIQKKIPDGVSRLRIIVKDETSPKLRTSTRHWSLTDWQIYAQRVERLAGDKPGRPTQKDYVRASHILGGPSREQIRQDIGINNLNELIGYPNVTAWSKADFIEWGVSVHTANPEVQQPFDPACIDALSARDAGPSRHLIYKNFGSLPEFRSQVHERIVALKQKRQRYLEHFAELVEEYGLPSSHGSDQQLEVLTDDQKIAITAKYNVAVKVLGDDPLHLHKAWIIAGRVGSTYSFSDQLRNSKPELTDDEIRLQAAQLDVVHDIWPTNLNLDRLQLHAEDVEAIHDEERTQRTTQHQEDQRITSTVIRTERTKAKEQPLFEYPSTPQPAPPDSVVASIREVRAGLELPQVKASEAMEWLNTARWNINEAYETLAQAATGTSDSTLEQIMREFSSAAAEIEAIYGSVTRAHEMTRSIINRL